MKLLPPLGTRLIRKKMLDRIIINFIPKRSITKYYHLSFLINLTATTIIASVLELLLIPIPISIVTYIIVHENSSYIF